MSQPENEKVYSLGDYVAVCSETTYWFICVISEINDPSKEVKVRFMKKSGQYFLLSKSWKSGPKVSNTIPSIDNRMRYSFDAIDIKTISDKIKTLDRDFKMGPSYLQITPQMNGTKRKLLILIKNSIACSCVSHKLLMYPIEDNCFER